MAPSIDTVVANFEDLRLGMHEHQYDLFVIGGGSAGTRAAVQSVKKGAKVAVCELPYSLVSSETTAGGVGGTCVLRGCVPKKILLYGSSFRREFDDAGKFGWKIGGEITFEWKTLLENKAREVQRLSEVYKKQLVNAGVTIIEGFGRLVDTHAVEVNQTNGEVKKYTANHILIATGSRAKVPNIRGKELGITSDKCLSFAELPRKIIMLGAGYIGVEFSGIFSAMGCEVHLIYRREFPLRGFDEDMRPVVARNLAAMGVKLHPSSTIVELQSHDGLGSRIRALSHKNEEFFADAVLFATGRKPNTKWLNLDAVGVEVDRRTGAVKVNEYCQTSVPNIWAVGDVTNRMMLTPVAHSEGSALADTLFARKPTKLDYQIIPSAVFCQPPLSLVGLSEQAAIADGTRDILVYSSTCNPMKNTISGRQETSHMKLVVDAATDKVLGAWICGPDAPEIIQGIAVALKCGATKAQFDATLGIHPTAAEELVTMRTLTRKVSRDGNDTPLS